VKPYKHIQENPIHKVFIALNGIGLILLLVLVEARTLRSLIVVIVLMVISPVIWRIFGKLTTTVDEDEVVASFGWGWPRRRVERSRVISATAVRNSAIYGWGIRRYPGGWLWNVWGLDAVELQLRPDSECAPGSKAARKEAANKETANKETYWRIGTDDQAGLLAALGIDPETGPQLDPESDPEAD